jgi:hypothetical protein
MKKIESTVEDVDCDVRALVGRCSQRIEEVPSWLVGRWSNGVFPPSFDSSQPSSRQLNTICSWRSPK